MNEKEREREGSPQVQFIVSGVYERVLVCTSVRVCECTSVCVSVQKRIPEMQQMNFLFPYRKKSFSIPDKVSRLTECQELDIFCKCFVNLKKQLWCS